MGAIAGESVKLGRISSSINSEFWISAPLSGRIPTDCRLPRPLSYPLCQGGGQVSRLKSAVVNLKSAFSFRYRILGFRWS